MAEAVAWSPVEDVDRAVFLHDGVRFGSERPWQRLGVPTTGVVPRMPQTIAGSPPEDVDRAVLLHDGVGDRRWVHRSAGDVSLTPRPTLGPDVAKGPRGRT